MKTREILKASLSRLIRFSTYRAFESYLEKLKGDFKVEFWHENPDGTVFALIHQQYNNVELI